MYFCMLSFELGCITKKQIHVSSHDVKSGAFFISFCAVNAEKKRNQKENETRANDT